MASRRESLLEQLKQLDVDEVAEAVRELEEHVSRALDPSLTAEEHDELARAVDEARAGKPLVAVDDVDQFLASLAPKNPLAAIPRSPSHR